jgi:hypothetical protein
MSCTDEQAWKWVGLTLWTLTALVSFIRLGINAQRKHP